MNMFGEKVVGLRVGLVVEGLWLGSWFSSRGLHDHPARIELDTTRIAMSIANGACFIPISRNPGHICAIPTQGGYE